MLIHNITGTIRKDDTDPARFGDYIITDEMGQTYEGNPHFQGVVKHADLDALIESGNSADFRLMIPMDEAREAEYEGRATPVYIFVANEIIEMDLTTPEGRAKFAEMFGED